MPGAGAARRGDQLRVDERAVALGGVQQGDAELEGTVDGGQGFGLVGGAVEGIQQDIADLAAQLAEQHLTNGHLAATPYQRETQRYGGPGAIGAAEAVFAADSALVRTLDTPAAARPRPTPAALRRRRETLRPQCRAAAVPADLTDLWSTLLDTLTAYRPLLTDDVAPLCASDLIHMHCNRLLGTDRDHEHLARSLATDLLRRA
ncbi:lantibiotic dehydratase C-terminal domain-containing protein [Kitasatospora purpeofusca]|uniref:lantibiotic dehydratase C-terminal domain-containing protein n=1 Tax=Kitasatospora purpeofusca TaxID=67352 RepID=UPI0035DF3ED8